jgi:hypothetical protein
MIEVVAHEMFYKDVAHEPLHPAVSKDPRTSRIASSSPVVAPSHTTRSGGASSSSSANFSILKMFQGIFAIYCRTDQRMEVMEQRIQIVWRNQKIIHSQWDAPLLEFPDLPVYPPVLDPYASLTPVELAAFGIDSARDLNDDDDDDDDDDEEANDDEETDDDE